MSTVRQSSPSTAAGVAAPAPRGRQVFPRPVVVSLGGQVVAAIALSVRYGRRGHQTLVAAHGTIVWVSTHRVADPRETGSTPG